ncbi:MAG: hypothetical protein EOM20_04920 [Spartobacteria bacterium]|nr:hypothetical protein [Spartobacteria bacterium]
MISWRFKLAGVPFRLLTSDDALHFPVAYDAFMCGPDEADDGGNYMVLSAEDTSLLPVLPDRVLWRCTTWRMGYLEDDRVGIEIHRVTDGAWAPVVNVNGDFSEGTICPRYGRWATPAPHAINYPYDQALLLNRLLHFDAGIVHACGIVINGSGYIFSGPSDIGKTTLARLWRASGATLLNDDRVILRLVDDRPWLAATPWHGEEPEVQAMMVPLKGVYFLEQAPENRMLPITSVAAVSRLTANSVAPFYLPAAMERLLTLWSHVVEQVDTGILRFTPDARAVEVCREVVGV